MGALSPAPIDRLVSGLEEGAIVGVKAARAVKGCKGSRQRSSMSCDAARAWCM